MSRSRPAEKLTQGELFAAPKLRAPEPRDLQVPVEARACTPTRAQLWQFHKWGIAAGGTRCERCGKTLEFVRQQTR